MSTSDPTRRTPNGGDGESWSVARAELEFVTSTGPGRLARRSIPLTILALLLTLAEPLGVAFYASSILTTIIDRGGWAVFLLAVRLAISGIGLGAGLALWNRRPGAASFARFALVLTAAGVLLTFLAPTFPHNRQPGTTAPILLVLLAYYAAWFAYLSRVRARL